MSLYHDLHDRWDTPGRAAIVTPDQEVWYGELGARARRAAGLLRAHGVQAGDTVALMLSRRVEFLDLFLGGLMIGAATIPMNDRYTDSEVSYVLHDARPKVAFLPDAVSPVVPTGCAVVREADLGRDIAAATGIATPPPPPDDAIAAICYTSGTTGRPKGARLSHANLRAMLVSLHGAWGWTDADVLVHALPLFHIHGLFVAQLGALWAGATTHWMPRFEALDALRTIERTRATVFMGVPTFYQRLLELPSSLPVDLSSIRLFTCGSAALPSHVWRAFRHRFGHEVLERYGMTEVGIVLSNPYTGERRPGAVGRPLPHVEARIVAADTDELLADGQVGELRIRGSSVFRGYLNQPEKTADAFDADGYLKTGDMALREPDGYYQIVGRLRDLVIAGGLNIYPSEVESVLADHPGVAEVAAVGVIDADLGEKLVADVVPRPGFDLVPAELELFARKHLAPYKRPRAWRIVPSLPRNAMGKVEKTTLRSAWEKPVVRGARPDDAPILAKGNLAMAEELAGLRLDVEAAYEGVRMMFDHQPRGRYFVAEIAGSHAGHMLVTLTLSDWRAQATWWMHHPWIHPAYRRRGVFRTLVQAVREAAIDAGALGLRAWRDASDPVARETFERLGLTRAETAVYELPLPPRRGTT